MYRGVRAWRPSPHLRLAKHADSSLEIQISCLEREPLLTWLVHALAIGHRRPIGRLRFNSLRIWPLQRSPDVRHMEQLNRDASDLDSLVPYLECRSI
jgi:hypothetical protein